MKLNAPQFSSVALIAFAALTFTASLNAAVVLAPLFADGAVFQREKPVPIWGTADAGERVSVSFAGQTVAATASPEGRWRVTLAALQTSLTPRDLVVKGTNTLTVRDVLVGEVWIASGQSNMEWPLSSALDAKTEIKAANFPQLRQFKVERDSSFTPLATATGKWVTATPETAGQFTAVGYFFGRELHQKLNVPIGIINSSWGGTGVGAWLSPDAYKADLKFAKQWEQQEKAKRATPEETAAYEAELAKWTKQRDDAKAAKKQFAAPAPKAPAGMAGPRTPAGLYNAMINPLVPYALRGAIWYQGESNTAQANTYNAYFSALITGWRKQFAQGDFPFYWVQLPNLDFANSNDTNWSWAQLREAQTQTLSVPNTAQAITIDVGEAKQLHPKNKKPVGQRLAFLALARTYKIKDVVDSGPIIAAAKPESRGYRVSFTPATTSLKAAEAGLTGFELAGADKVFHAADARIEGQTVFVKSTEVTEPIALRYAYRNAPVAGLLNNEGLPAAPFRTDTWEAPAAPPKK